MAKKKNSKNYTLLVNGGKTYIVRWNPTGKKLGTLNKYCPVERKRIPFKTKK